MKQVEKGLLWLKWQEETGVKRVLFDLDGTLADTYAVFLPIVEEGKKLLLGDDPDNLRQYFESLNGTALNNWGVNPIRWDWIVDEMRAAFSIDDNACELAKMKFRESYTTPIKLNDGAFEILSFLGKIGTKSGVVTHGNRKWTDLKVECLGLERFMPRSSVYVVDENGRKGPEQWREAISYFGLLPEEVVVVGDSSKSDMKPAEDIGVIHRFWYRGPGSESWNHGRAVLSPSTREIFDLRQLMTVVR